MVLRISFQIQMLLIEKRVEEAIELSIVANKLHSSEYDEKVGCLSRFCGLLFCHNL